MSVCGARTVYGRRGDVGTHGDVIAYVQRQRRRGTIGPLPHTTTTALAESTQNQRNPQMLHDRSLTTGGTDPCSPKGMHAHDAAASGVSGWRAKPSTESKIADFYRALSPVDTSARSMMTHSTQSSGGGGVHFAQRVRPSCDLAHDEIDHFAGLDAGCVCVSPAPFRLAFPLPLAPSRVSFPRAVLPFPLRLILSPLARLAPH